MNEATDVLWRSVQPLLETFAGKIATANPAVTYIVEATANDAFMLRGYASFRKAAAGDELAVTVDGAFTDNGILLSSDACMEDGEVLAEGSTASFQLSALAKNSTPLTEWLGSFEDFLSSIEATVKDRVAAL